MRSVYEQRRLNLRSIMGHWGGPISDIRRWVKAGVVILVGSGVIHIAVHLMD